MNTASIVANLRKQRKKIARELALVDRILKKLQAQKRQLR